MIIPDHYKAKVDESTFNRRLDIGNEEDFSEKRVNGFMVYQNIFYDMEKLRDSRLFDYFQEDFEGWTKDIFALADSGVRRMLRDFLNDHGIYTPKSRSHISIYLAYLVNATSLPEWPENEIEKQIKEARIFDSALRPVETSLSVVMQENLNAKGKNIDTNVYKDLDPNSSNQKGTNTQAHQERKLRYQGYDTTNFGNWARIISDMKKIYDDSKRFSGNEYDPLEIKLNIFEERCKIMGIENAQKHNVFEVMLVGKASDYYYSDLALNQSLQNPRNFN
ncbi:integrase and RNaseH domain-containing protein [Golovinomyces cichoracearum]|uniref:Integrase and RNaseH domain-containing protein n=1 Tax=Golovinomyces cichoracearum TaxID=62708 RepID=A0A420H9L3_9PEZI|nr:integrase and RNaseH domain-containing protein [Golovinomyces cichoracearum]